MLSLYFENSPWVSRFHSPSLIYVCIFSIHLAWCSCRALSHLLPFIFSLLTIIVRRSHPLFFSLSFFLGCNLSITRIKAAGSFIPSILATRISLSLSLSLSFYLSFQQAFHLALDSFIGNIHLHSSSSVVGIRQTGIHCFFFVLFLFYFSRALSFSLFLSLTLTFPLSH